MKKPTICVIFGGASSEHEVSCVSAASICRNIDPERFDVVRLGIARNGDSFLFSGTPEQMESGQWLLDRNNRSAHISHNPSDHGLLFSDGEILPIDLLFPVLHGKNGEDGSIQGLFQLSGIPYVGCGILSSAICMDKEMTHIMLASAGIPMARYAAVRKSEPFSQALEKARKIGFPLFVKPANAGSSVGVSKVSEEGKLAVALEAAFAEDDKLLLEEAIIGAEVECAVLDGEELTASVVGEIVPANSFYDYNAKYQNAESLLYIPARIPQDQAELIRRTALAAFRRLECRGLSRVDFFARADGSIILNEINTLPGFTSISMYPKLFEASGIPYPQLLEKLIATSLRGSGNKN
ncbi:MAG: D-alanine--D-alanine ligase [Oscillospiraceae bacterium]|nr:D-alanine--D-alanine ligase [Oscillospiraceae bacterium]